MLEAAANGLTLRQHWVSIATGMQKDLERYGELQELLRQQFHAALRHDAPAMERIAHQITAQTVLLQAARTARVQHVQALLPAGQVASMDAVLSQLKPPLQTQLRALWSRLEAQVQTCKSMNLRNGACIMEQAQLMRQVLGGGMPEEDIYAPR